MSARIRIDGTIVCAAMRPAQLGDKYIDDAVHEYLTGADGRLPLHSVLCPDRHHSTNALWHWTVTHGPCRCATCTGEKT